MGYEPAVADLVGADAAFADLASADAPQAPASTDGPEAPALDAPDVSPSLDAPDAPPLSDAALVEDGSGLTDTTAAPTYPFRKRLTIPAGRVSEDLVDFPVLVSLTGDADLMARAATGVAFTTAAGPALAHEIEAFVPAEGRLLAWVRLPRVAAAAATTFHLVYGAAVPTPDPGAAWNDGYLAVWHLGETGAGQTGEYRDVTRGAHHGTGGSGLADQVPVRGAGMIGDGQVFDGNHDHIGHPLPLPRAAGTISYWQRPMSTRDMVTVYESDRPLGTLDSRDGFSSGGIILELHAGNFSSQWCFIYQDGDGTPETPIGLQGLNGGTVVAGQWTHFAATWDQQGEAVLYVDGVRITSKGMTGKAFQGYPSVFHAIGRASRDFASRSYLGTLDEVRISRVARSAAWIAASHDNQRSPALFVQVGPEERP